MENSQAQKEKIGGFIVPLFISDEYERIQLSIFENNLAKTLFNSKGDVFQRMTDIHS